jgi:hypothetical protein
MYYVDRLNNGQHPKGRKRLAIGYDFKCAKQPLGSHGCMFLCREIFNAQGRFFDKNGTLADFPQLCNYERFGL